MTLEDNKQLAREAIGIWSTGDYDAAERIYAPEYVNHQHPPDGSRDLRGPAAMKQYAREFRTAFPDFHDTVELQLAEGDLVATRFRSTGTQRGSFLGIGATNRELSWTGTTIDRIVDGKIVESWANWDLAGLLQQLGALGSTG